MASTTVSHTTRDRHGTFVSQLFNGRFHCHACNKRRQDQHGVQQHVHLHADDTGAKPCPTWKNFSVTVSIEVSRTREDTQIDLSMDTHKHEEENCSSRKIHRFLVYACFLHCNSHVKHVAQQDVLSTLLAQAGQCPTQKGTFSAFVIVENLRVPGKRANSCCKGSHKREEDIHKSRTAFLLDFWSPRVCINATAERNTALSNTSTLISDTLKPHPSN